MPKPNAPYDEEVYKTVLKDGRVRATVLGYLCVVVIVMSIFVTISFLKQGVTTEAIRETQQEGSPLVQRLSQVSETIEDCVNPSGKCFQDGAKRTSAAVESIGDIVAITIVCADASGTQDYTTIKKCVDQKIKDLS